MRPVVAKIQNEMGAKVNVVVLDVYTKDGSKLAQEYTIQAVPTFIIFDKTGQQTQKLVGVVTFDQLKSELE